MKKVCGILICIFIIFLLLYGWIDQSIRNSKPYSSVAQEELLEKAISENNYIIIDVRTKEEYDEEHVVGAVHITYDEFEKNIDTYVEVYDGKDIIIYSGDGHESKKECSVFNPIDGGYALTVSKFDGRETLWSDTLEEDQDIEIDFSFILSEGQAKIVHIDAEGNVTTVIECLPENSTDGFVTKTVSLKSGENRLKIVGYDCEDVELKMLFEEP